MAATRSNSITIFLINSRTSSCTKTHSNVHNYTTPVRQHWDTHTSVCNTYQLYYYINVVAANEIIINSLPSAHHIIEIIHKSSLSLCGDYVHIKMSTAVTVVEWLRNNNSRDGWMAACDVLVGGNMCGLKTVTLFRA